MMKVCAILSLLLVRVAASKTYSLPFEGCPNVTVVHGRDTDGWKDGCEGLTKKPEANTTEKCKAQCYADMECDIWQMVKEPAGNVCWSGALAHGCMSRGSSETMRKFAADLVAGERIQHGFVKLVATNSKMETMGLKHLTEQTGDDASKIQRCKEFCYTDVTCTVWQYGASGCWIEHLPTNAKGETNTDSEFAKSMLAGETVEKTCPAYKPEEGLPWAWIISGIVVGLLALGAIVYALQRKPKVKKTRAVKMEPKPEPVQVMFVQQPTVLVPQTSVVMQSVPTYTTVAQAAPTTTYAAPMTTYAAPTSQVAPLLSGAR